MYTQTHNTRTLLISQKVNNTLIISRGSADNVDPTAEVVSSGQSQIKAFDLSKVPPGEPYQTISLLIHPGTPASKKYSTSMPLLIIH